MTKLPCAVFLDFTWTRKHHLVPYDSSPRPWDAWAYRSGNSLDRPPLFSSGELALNLEHSAIFSSGCLPLFSSQFPPLTGDRNSGHNSWDGHSTCAVPWPLPADAGRSPLLHILKTHRRLWILIRGPWREQSTWRPRQYSRPCPILRRAQQSPRESLLSQAHFPCGRVHSFGALVRSRAPWGSVDSPLSPRPKRANCTITTV